MKLPRISIRVGLIVIAIIATLLSCYVANQTALRHEQQVIAELESHFSPGVGYVLTLDSDSGFVCGTGVSAYAHKEPTWIVNRLGACFDPSVFERITEISVAMNGYSNESLKVIAKLPHLEKLSFNSDYFETSDLSHFKTIRPDVLLDIYHEPPNNDSYDPFKSGADPFE